MFYTFLYFCPGAPWKVSQIVLLNCMKSFCQCITDLIKAFPMHLASKEGCVEKKHQKSWKLDGLKPRKEYASQ